MKISFINDLLKTLNPVDEQYHVQGWIKNLQDTKNFIFLHLKDGSSINPLQIVVKKSDFLQEQISDLSDCSVYTSFEATGIIKFNNRSKQNELVAQNFKILKKTPANFWLQKQKHSLEFLRTIPHLRVQSNIFYAIFDLRSKLTFAVHEYLQKRNFVNISAPIITSHDAEGAGEQFVIENSEKFFNNKAFLTVSGQLAAESLALGFKNVYTFGPTFRAEKSNTLRHMAEFYMIEPEMAFADLNDVVELAFDMLNKLVVYTLENCQSHLDVISNYLDKNVTLELENFLKQETKQITYLEACQLINSFLNNNSQFSNVPKLKVNDELSIYHEKILTNEILKMPVAVTNYPSVHKPFYMKQTSDKQHVLCFDLLVPGIGELFGGSQREDEYDALINNFQTKHPGVNYDNFQWYFDLRKCGYAKSAGFGLGFERLLMFITKIENIRDVICFPRGYRHISQ